MKWAFWILSAVVAASTVTPATAQNPSDAERRRIEAIVKDYLTANPEVIVDALRGYEAKRQASAEKDAQAALVANRAALENDSTSPSVGNPKADVTVVEFFDYHCGYCKKVLPSLQEVLKADPKVRTVFMDLPILGPGSQQAALAGQAVWTLAPAKFFDFHVALMQTRGALDETVIMDTAKSVGIDPAKLKTAMANPALKAKIDANMELAQKLNINGTPAFIVGDQLMPGAVDADTLKQAIADARKQ